MEMMRLIDRIYTKFPYYGSRKIAKQLARQLEIPINRKRIQRLMRMMGIEAIYARPNTSKPHPNHKIYPYLLRNISAQQSNHIWGVDITYIPIHNSWLYLVAIIDWYSRYVLSWQLSDSLCVNFCVEALTRALNQSIPQFHNSDQGSQFTSNEYLSILQGHPQISVSMEGRGRAFDNIFTERLWRTVKHEEVYLHDYSSPAEARQSLDLGKYHVIVNTRHLHKIKSKFRGGRSWY